MNEDPWFFVLGFASTAFYALSLAVYRCLRNRFILGRIAKTGKCQGLGWEDGV